MKHRIVTAAQRKAIEQAGNAHGLPYLQMMENAGLAAYAELKNVLPQPGSLLVVCGKGNNGGDGFVIARAAAKEGWKMGGGHPARYLESVARLQQLRQMPVTELLSYKNRPLRADPDLTFRVSARRGRFVLSEFCHPQAMQIAVGIDRHRCLVAQLKSRSGCLARMEITDVAALRRFHIEPLDNTDYPIFHLCYPLQLPIYRHKYSILPPVRKGTDAKTPAGNCSQGLGLCAGVPHTGITVIQFR